MVSKSLRMNASASPEFPVTHRHFKRRVKSLTNLEDPKPEKYIHVHHFKNTKLFGAWFNDPSKSGKKARLFFGSHLTAYLAARAQDRAALKYKPYALDPRSIKLNFKEEDYVADQKLRDMLTCEEFGELLRKESRPKYTKMEPTRCLRKFMAHERALGNIPPAVPPKEEDILSLRRYLKEVIRKREQPDEDMEDPVPTDVKSSEDQGSPDEEMEDPVPIAEQKKHASKEERKKRSKGKRVGVYTEPRTPRSKGKGVGVYTEPRTPRSKGKGVGVFTEPRTPRSKGKRIGVYTEPRAPRSPVAGPSECKPLVSAPAPLVWGHTRQRSKLYENEHTKESSQEKNDYPLTTIVVTEGKFPARARNKLQYKLHKADSNKKSLEPIPPIKPENPKTPEPGIEGLPQSPELPESQFKSKRDYKLHKKLQTSKTSEPSPKNAGSFLQALAFTVLSQP